MSEGNFANERAWEAMTSRRKFLAGSAAALAGGALLAVPRVAEAHNPPNPPTDIDILNYALTLERLEATFYRRVLDRYSEGDFQSSAYLSWLGANVRNHIYENFQAISNHEDTHVKTLVTVIKGLGGKPVPPCEYNFGITSVESALKVARVLENTGVRAYDGAIAHIEAADYLTAGATIATVEARHASYLNLINGDEPFPKPFDEPVAPQKICNTVNSTFIVRSPKPYGPYKSLDALCAKLPNMVIAP